MRVNFHWVQWKNFLSTGNAFNRVQLDSYTNTLIVGKNGDGKSTILDALSFALFGKPFRNINKPQLINSINQKNCLVEVEFSVGVNRYRVVRGIKPAVFSIYLNDELINQDAANRDYQKVLEQQILKWNHKTFMQVVILGSTNFVPFMQLTSQNRRTVIEDILDISIFSSMNQLLKTKIDETKDKLSTVDFQIEKLKTQTISQKKIISTITSSKKDRVEEIKAEIEEQRQESNKAQLRIDELIDEVAKLNKSISNEDKVEQDLTRVIGLKSKYTTKVERYAETLKFFDHNDVCPTCSQHISDDHKETMSSEAQEKLDQSNSDLKLALEAYDKLMTRQKEIQSINSKILSLNTEMNSHRSAKKIIEQNISSLDKQIGRVNSDSVSLDSEKDKLQELIKTGLDLVEQKNKLIEEKGMQETASILLKDSGIKTSIVREYLPIINKLINSYLRAMDFYVHFELDESFNETIRSRFRDDFTYDSFSEGEKMRIDLAILFTWREIAKMKNSVNTNLLILDEIFDSSLDVAGTDYFLKVMEALDEKNNVFVISHKGDALLDKFTNILKFEKRNEFSVMV